MKKKISNKLSLDKDTISRLSAEQADLIAGGIGGDTNTCQCKSWWKADDEDQLLAAGTCCEDSCKPKQN